MNSLRSRGASGADREAIALAFRAAQSRGRAEGAAWLDAIRRRQTARDVTAESFTTPVSFEAGVARFAPGENFFGCETREIAAGCGRKGHVG